MTELVLWSRLVSPFMLGAFAAVVFVRLLTGQISTSYLFYGERAGGRLYFSSGRVQLLVITLFVALDYLLSVLRNSNRASLPDVDMSILGLLFGSHAVYLSGKARALLFSDKKEK